MQTFNTCISTSETIKSTIQTNIFIIIPFFRSFGTMIYNENIVGFVPDIFNWRAYDGRFESCILI